MWEAVASILMKNRERIGSWRDYSVSDYHYYSSAVTFIGLDVIKVTLIFSFSSSSFFFSSLESVYACSFSLTRCVMQSLRGSSISVTASQDGDKIQIGLSQSQSVIYPSCCPWGSSHLSSLRTPILGTALIRNTPYLSWVRPCQGFCPGAYKGTLPVCNERQGLEYITPLAMNCCYLK